MKVKTADLIGPALDWAVAKCLGSVTELAFDGITYGFDLNGKTKVLAKGWAPSMSWHPSTNWSQGGALIEQEAIGIGCLGKSAIYANPWLAARMEDNTEYAGPTPLIAACRCLVASQFGDEVDVPEELLK